MEQCQIVLVRSNAEKANAERTVLAAYTAQKFRAAAQKQTLLELCVAWVGASEELRICAFGVSAEAQRRLTTLACSFAQHLPNPGEQT